jgi:hypothetical protein
MRFLLFFTLSLSFLVLSLFFHATPAHEVRYREPLGGDWPAYPAEVRPHPAKERRPEPEGTADSRSFQYESHRLRRRGGCSGGLARHLFLARQSRDLTCVCRQTVPRFGMPTQADASCARRKCRRRRRLYWKP